MSSAAHRREPEVTSAGTADPSHTFRIPGLDGIRGLAIVLVVLAHIGWPGFEAGGTTGVTVFFTLSGFLITSLLLVEFDRSRRIDLGAFWMRRALRLFPALWVYLAVSIVVYRVLGYEPLRTLLKMALAPFFYYANWTEVNTLGPFNHTWSLAVEEQFYIVWPLLVLLLLARLPRLWLPILLVAVAVLGIWWRLHMGLTPSGYTPATRRTDTNAFSLVAGAALAAAVRAGLRIPRMPNWVADLTVAAVVAIPVAFGRQLSISGVTAPVYATGLTLILLVGVLGGGAGVLNTASLRFVGVVSYGWYLWHWLALELVVHADDYTQDKAAWGLVAGIASFGAAVVSYYAIEKPALRLKKRFERASLRPATAGEPTATGKPTATSEPTANGEPEPSVPDSAVARS